MQYHKKIVAANRNPTMYHNIFTVTLNPHRETVSRHHRCAQMGAPSPHKLDLTLF